jgi:hypothetical protein
LDIVVTDSVVSNIDSGSGFSGVNETAESDPAVSFTKTIIGSHSL